MVQESVLLDSIIIGSGAGGMSCALELQDSRIRYVVLERAPILGAGLQQITNTVKNFIGGFLENGEALRQRLNDLADKMNCHYLLNHEVSAANLRELSVRVNDRTFKAKSVVIATGYRRRRLMPEQERNFKMGIHYDMDSGAQIFQGQPVLIVGGGDSAITDALELSPHCPAIYIVNRSSSFRARPDVIAEAKRSANINLMTDTQVQSLNGDDQLESVTVFSEKTGETKVLSAPNIIVRIGYAPNTEIFREQVDMDAHGHILIGADCSTSVPGVFAVGDVTNPGYPRIATAVGHGMIAAAAIRELLMS